MKIESLFFENDELYFTAINNGSYLINKIIIDVSNNIITLISCGAPESPVDGKNIYSIYMSKVIDNIGLLLFDVYMSKNSYNVYLCLYDLNTKSTLKLLNLCTAGQNPCSNIVRIDKNDFIYNIGYYYYQDLVKAVRVSEDFSTITTYSPPSNSSIRTILYNNFSKNGENLYSLIYCPAPLGGDFIISCNKILDDASIFSIGTNITDIEMYKANIPGITYSSYKSI